MLEYIDKGHFRMPIKNGFQATQGIRAFEASNPLQSHSRPTITINGRIPIFAVSASLEPVQREYMESLGMDGWMLKPIDFKRMNGILKGITNPERRRQEAWEPGFSWESGGWLLASPAPVPSLAATGGEESNIPTPPEDPKAVLSTPTLSTPHPYSAAEFYFASSPPFTTLLEN